MPARSFCIRCAASETCFGQKVFIPTGTLDYDAIADIWNKGCWQLERRKGGNFTSLENEDMCGSGQKIPFLTVSLSVPQRIEALSAGTNFYLPDMIHLSFLGPGSSRNGDAGECGREASVRSSESALFNKARNADFQDSIEGTTCLPTGQKAVYHVLRQDCNF